LDKGIQPLAVRQTRVQNYRVDPLFQPFQPLEQFGASAYFKAVPVLAMIRNQSGLLISSSTRRMRVGLISFCFNATSTINYCLLLFHKGFLPHGKRSSKDPKSFHP
jgi:hypothetical protein